MKEDFKHWMAEVEKKVPNTVYNYSEAIHKISQYYTTETGINIDIYQNNDLQFLKRISSELKIGGKYGSFGDEYHGLYRNAITAYVRFLVQTGKNSKNIECIENTLLTSKGKIEVKKN